MIPVSTLLRLCLVVFAGLATARVAADVIVDPEVLDAVASGRAQVIIQLRLEGGFAPEGWLTEQDVRAQRAAIAAAQEAVLSELANSDARLVRRQETVPFLALDIGAPALAELRAMPDRVARILEDKTTTAKRPQSIGALP